MAGQEQRIGRKIVADAILRRSKAAQSVREEVVLRQVIHEHSDLLTSDAVCAIRSRLSVDTPRAADPGLRKRDIRLIETLASETREDRPPPWQRVPEALECLFAWLRRTRDGGQCPLLVGAAAHHGIVLIHPFLNGNGRAARVLGSAVIHGGPRACRVSISSTFGRRPADYYDVVRRTLYRTGDFGDWLVFLSDRMNCRESGPPTCPDVQHCRYHVSFVDLMARYGRFVEKVKGT